MSGKIEISRKLIERAACNLTSGSDAYKIQQELLEVLAAPVVERQEPVAIVTGSTVQWLPGAGTVKDRAELYTSPPAPVADDLVRLLTRARIYARGEFRDEIDKCLLKAKRMNK